MIEALLTIKIGIDPNLFSIGGVDIAWHGVFTALGVVFGVLVAAWLAKRAGFDDDTIYNVALALVVGGIIGARGLFVLEHLGDFKDSPENIFDINAGGISIYGALIGGTIGAWGYAMIRRVRNIPRAADIAAIGGIIGMMVGRIGDVINGEHFSSSTSLPWGVVYTHSNSPSFLRFGADALPQHPTVAYEFIGDLLVLGVLLFMYQRVQRYGIVFFSWVFLYGLLRVFVSFLRLDDIVFLGLRTAQIIAVIMMPFGLAGLWYLWRTPPQEQRMSRAERRRTIREASERSAR